jgi:O-antigen biosynthesis protein
MNGISAIIVSYNKGPYTQLCLEGLLRCTPAPAQIIVIDNGSDDDSLARLERVGNAAQRAGVEWLLIANETNLGACTARNQGLAEARAEFIAFVDNDTVVRRLDWLGRLAHRLQADSRLGIVGPKLLFPFAPFAIECAGVGISPTGRVQYRGRGCPNHACDEPAQVQCLISAAWLMKRTVIDAVGFLDEAFNPAQFEDFDYCYRAREAGWTVGYEPSSELYHFENVTTRGSQDLRFNLVTLRNWRLFRQRWQHCFAGEGGPPDDECSWADLPTHPLEETGIPPVMAD